MKDKRISIATLFLVTFLVALFSFVFVQYRAYTIEVGTYSGTTLRVDRDGNSEYIPPPSFWQWLIDSER